MCIVQNVIIALLTRSKGVLCRLDEAKKKLRYIPFQRPYTTNSGSLRSRYWWCKVELSCPGYLVIFVNNPFRAAGPLVADSTI